VAQGHASVASFGEFEYVRASQQHCVIISRRACPSARARIVSGEYSIDVYERYGFAVPPHTQSEAASQLTAQPNGLLPTQGKHGSAAHATTTLKCFHALRCTSRLGARTGKA
jgi:hypothetical protein